MSAADFRRGAEMMDEINERNPLFWHQFALVVAVMATVAILVVSVRITEDRDRCHTVARLQGATRGEYTVAGGCIGIKPDGQWFRPTGEVAP